MKRKSSQSFKNLNSQNKEVNLTCLYVKKILQVGFISLCLLSCLSIKTYAQEKKSGGSLSSSRVAPAVPAQGNLFAKVGKPAAQAPKVDTPAAPVSAPRVAQAAPKEPLRQPAPPVASVPKPENNPARFAPPSRPTNDTPKAPVPSLTQTRAATGYFRPTQPMSFAKPVTYQVRTTYIDPLTMPKPNAVAIAPIKMSSLTNLGMPTTVFAPIPKPATNTLKPIQAPKFAKPLASQLTPIDKLMVKPLNVSAIPALKPLTNQFTPIETPKFSNSLMTNLKPIESLKPLRITPIAMPKPLANTLIPIKTPAFSNSAISQLTPIDKLMTKPLSVNAISMPKPIVNTLKPVQLPDFAKPAISAITTPKFTSSALAPLQTPKFSGSLTPNITPIDSLMTKPIGITPMAMPKPIANTFTAIEVPKFSKPLMTNITPIDNLKPIGLTPMTTPKPLVNTLTPMQAPAFAKPFASQLTPIEKLIAKPLGISTMPAPKPIANTFAPVETPRFSKASISNITSIESLKPLVLAPIAMPKPLINTLTPMQAPAFSKSAISQLTPIEKLIAKPLGVNIMPAPKPIANAFTPIEIPQFSALSISPLAIPKSIAGFTTNIDSLPFMKYTAPKLVPINKLMVKPIATIVNAPKPIAIIKPLPVSSYLQSLEYIDNTLDIKTPGAQITPIPVPNFTVTKITPLQVPEIKSHSYVAPHIPAPVMKPQHYALNRQVVENTLAAYNTKIFRDAARINTLIAPDNILQKYFDGKKNYLKVDLAKFVQNNSEQRKQLINQAQTYGNTAELQKLQALNTWRNEYDKFLALSSNISTIVKETGGADPSSLKYLRDTKENLDALTRNIAETGIDKGAVEQFITNVDQAVPVAVKPYELMPPPTLSNPQNLPLDSIAPKTNFLGGLTQGVGNFLSPALHAEDKIPASRKAN